MSTTGRPAVRRARARPATLALLCGLLASVPAGAAAQRLGAAVVPDTVSVGDIFHVVVRIEVPPGMRIAFPDTLDVVPDVEAAARRELRYDTSAAGVESVAAVYALTAWRPGTVELPAARLRLLVESREEVLEARIPAFAVESVLPADTAGIEPRPAKDVLGADRAMLPLLLMLLLVSGLIAFVAWLWRRRRRKPPVEAAPLPVAPRVAALLELDRLVAAGLIERGDLRTFYFTLTAIVRGYVDAVNPAWGTDLTTAELRARMNSARAFDVRHAGGPAAGVPAPMQAQLDGLLAGADLIKFARQRATAEQAQSDLSMARRWIERFDWPPLHEERAA